MPTAPQPGATAPADRRRAWIAEAAYYLAERRRFRGGCPVEDWLRAERLFDRQDARPPPSPRAALVFLDRRPAGESSAGI